MTLASLTSAQSGSRRGRCGSNFAAVEELEQKDHLVLAFAHASFLRPVEALDAVIQLRARPVVRLLALENTRSEKLRDVLKLVCGKAQQKLARFAPLPVRNHRAEGFHQNAFHRR